MQGQPPSADVLDAFGVADAPAPLGGGQQSSWRAGRLVFKPADRGEAELAWEADLLGSIPRDGFRVARPQAAQGRSFVVGGWCAWEWIEGRHEERRWAEIISVGEQFHDAVADRPRPAFIGRRTDRWAVGDRVAWGELPSDRFARVKHLPRLVAALRPVDAPAQLVHGDLTGNVLFAAGLPPGIIDLSPFWRPTAYAAAIVVADALVWEGADEGLLEAVAHIERFEQFLLRALIMRAIVDRLFREGEPSRPDDSDPYLVAVELALRVAGSA